MTKEEVLEGIDEPLWFAAYSHALQWVGEAARRWKWEWPVGKTPEVRVSPLIHTFWEETGNYVPRVSQEVAQIARLRARRLVSSSTSEEEEEEQEEADPKPPTTDAEPKQSEGDEDKIR